jgi:hypothetical protein
VILKNGFLYQSFNKVMTKTCLNEIQNLPMQVKQHPAAQPCLKFYLGNDYANLNLIIDSSLTYHKNNTLNDKIVKPEKVKEVKPVVDDIELSENGKLICKAIDVIIQEAKNNPVNKSKHKNSDLLNSQIEELIEEFSYPVVLIAVKLFYAWKCENPSPKLKFASDKGSIKRQFIPQAQIEYAKQSGNNQTADKEAEALAEKHREEVRIAERKRLGLRT